MDLLPDKEVDLPTKPYGVLIVREVRNDDVERQLLVAKHAYAAMARELQTVVLVPFCMADERFSEYVAKECNDAAVMKDVWNDPAKLQWIIGNADYVVSAGRLHPLVFSVGSRRPCYAVTYPWLNGYDKVNGFMHHAGLGQSCRRLGEFLLLKSVQRSTTLSDQGTLTRKHSTSTAVT